MTDMPVLAIEHIVLHPEKGPVIAGTNFRVAFLATFLDKPDWTVERIVKNYSLTPAQIYAAWAYYYDHKEEIDQQLREIAEHQWTIGVDTSTRFADHLKKRD